MQVGIIVFFSGNLDLISTSQGIISSIDIPWPIATAFTISIDAVGEITSTVGATGIIEANTGSTKYLQLKFRSDIIQQMFVSYFSGSYIIINIPFFHFKDCPEIRSEFFQTGSYCIKKWPQSFDFFY